MKVEHRTLNVERRTLKEEGKRILALWGDWLAAGVWVAVFGYGAFSSGLRRFSSHFKRWLDGVRTPWGVGLGPTGQKWPKGGTPNGAAEQPWPRGRAAYEEAWGLGARGSSPVQEVGW